MSVAGNFNSSRGAAAKWSWLYITAGWISAVLSLAVLPFVFGVFGVIMGILANKHGNKGGLPVIMASILFMGLGLIFSNIFLSYLRRNFGF